MPDVERDATTTRDHVCGARIRLDSTRGRDQPLRAVGVRFHTANPFGGSGDRILTNVHRRGARMTCNTNERDVRGGSSADSIDHRQGTTCSLEYGTLLDVEFEVAEWIRVGARISEARRIEAKIADRLRDGHAVGCTGSPQSCVTISDRSAVR